MLGAFEALVRRGGIHGIGMTMITQRPAVINKNVLSQVELLIVLQLTAPQDRAAVEEWVRGNASKAASDAVLATLASLPQGTAWVWSPAWLDVLARVQVSQRTTYNSSATPQVGATRMLPDQLAPVDLDRVRQQLAGAAGTAVSDDPAVLHQRIAGLDQQLRQRPVAPVIQQVDVPVLTDGDRQALTDYAAQLAATADQFATLGTQMLQQAAIIQTALDQAGIAASGSSAPAPTPAPTRTNGTTRPRTPAAAAPATDRHAAQQRMLTALAAWSAFGVAHLAQQNLAVCSDQSPTSSAYDGHLRRLKADGLIVRAGGMVSLTAAGRQVAPAPAQPASLAALHAAWQTKLHPKAGAILQVLIAACPHGLDRTALAAASEQSATSSAYAGHLRRLRTLGLLATDGDQITATALLFPDQAVVHA